MRTTGKTRTLALACLLTISGPALAKTADSDAQAAIADAQAKIVRVTKLGADLDLPRMVVDATSALQSARADLKAGNTDASLANALLAHDLATTAIAVIRPLRAQAIALRAEEADLAHQAELIAAWDRDRAGGRQLASLRAN